MSHASLLVALDAPTDGCVIEELIQQEMEPFDENGEGFAEGSRWDWWVIGGRYDGLLSDGNMLRRSEVNLAVLERRQRERLRQIWQRHVLAYNGPANVREFLTGAKEEDTEASYVGRHVAAPFPAHVAFLRRRCWQEHARLGWFGVRAATECEQAGRDVHICTHEHDGARIVSWNDSDSWHTMFYQRFVEPLAADTLLITVDYHV